MGDFRESPEITHKYSFVGPVTLLLLMAAILHQLRLVVYPIIIHYL